MKKNNISRNNDWKPKITVQDANTMLKAQKHWYLPAVTADKVTKYR